MDSFWQIMPLNKNLCVTMALLLGRLLCCSAFSPNDTIKSDSEFGTPYILDPAPELQRRSPQNWFVWQSPNKIIYVSNLSNLLEYDGTTWKKHDTNNQRIVGMDSDRSDIIYAVKDYDFGYFSPNASRKLVFTSLLKTLPDELPENIRMRSCFAVREGVYFIANDYIFFRNYSGHIAIQKAKAEIMRAFKEGNTLYALQKNIGLTRISEKEQTVIQGSEFLSDEGVIGIFKQSDESLLICTNSGKFYRYNGSAFQHAFSVSLAIDLNFKCYQPVVQLPDGRYAFATRQRGILLFSETGKLIASIDRLSGLRNNLINGLCIDQDGALWAVLDNGVNRVEVSSPLTFLDERAGLESAVLKTIRHKGVLYFATMTGLYSYQPGQSNRVTAVQPDFNFPVWDLLSKNDLLLAATNAGLYLIANNKPQLLTSKDHYCRSVIASGKFKDIFYASTSTGILVIKQVAGEKWKVIKEIEFARGFADYLKEDVHGDIWATAYNSGYFKIVLPAHEEGVYPAGEPAVHSYDLSHGVHSMVGNRIFEVNGTLVFSSGDMLLQYDAQQDKFVKQHVIPDKEGIIAKQVIRLKEDEKENLYIDLSFDDTNRVFILNKKGEAVSSPFFFRLEKNSLYDIMIDKDSIVWLGGAEGVTRVDLRLLQRQRPPAFETMVRSVVLNGDSILFDGYDTAGFSIRLPYHKNNMLRFGFGAPTFDNTSENQFQYFLEGYDNDWSGWTSETQKDYTNLMEGTYTIHVRAKNIYHVIGREDTMVITILPPWYRTWWAYTLYILVSVLGVRTIIKWRLKALSEEKANLEQVISNRTRELAQKNVQLEEQAQKLLTLDTLKSRFFANISHEFRTPLTLILGPLEQFFKSRGEKMPDGAALEIMYRNSKRLHQLIDQLLYITRLENGYARLTVQQEDIHQAIRIMLVSFDSLADQRKINYHYAIPKEPCQLLFDADKLEKIISNLLSNAFKFTREGGSVNVTLAFSQDGKAFTHGNLQHCTDAQWMQIRVQDTGIGIPEKDLRKIFDRFYQVDNSDVGEFSGTGIGLSLVTELLKLYGGTIDVHSKEGEGTCFTVTIPVSTSSLPKHELTDGVSIARENLPLETPSSEIEDEITVHETQDKITVLIAEDSADMQHYIKTALTDQYECISAMNGTEGMDLAVTRMPDLVITDIMMPEINGLELCRQLKTDERTSHIPVIMLTARADQSSKVEGLKTGADDYLSKPFDVEELKIKIHNLVTRHNKLRERYQSEVRIEPSGVTATSLDETFLKKLISIVEENLANPAFTVEDFAVKAGVSRTKLHRKITALTGQSASDFIRELRMKRAAQLLEKNSDFISQIGYQVGFSDQSYFAKCFRKQFGMSPSDYVVEKFSKEQTI